MENGSGGSIAIKVKLKHFVVQDYYIRDSVNSSI